MKSLPKEYILLKEIGNVLNKYLKSPDTSVEIRSTELYEVISKKPELKAEFPVPSAFNRFLRKQHQRRNMSQFISYRVDTANEKFYQWYFRRNLKKNNEPAINNDTIEGAFNYYKNSKTIYASDGTKLNSTQEVLIYEQLKKCSHLCVSPEHSIRRNGESKYVDFTILNKLTQKVFYWEHLGMTNSEEYRNKMTDKVDWYRKNGIYALESGGNMIYTYYTTDNRLKKDIDKFIEIITESNNT